MIWTPTTDGLELTEAECDSLDAIFSAMGSLDGGQGETIARNQDDLMTEAYIIGFAYGQPVGIVVRPTGDVIICEAD